MKTTIKLTSKGAEIQKHTPVQMVVKKRNCMTMKCSVRHSVRHRNVATLACIRRKRKSWDVYVTEE